MKRLLPLLLLLMGSVALAESGSYRVEVIIFRNLAVAVDSAKVDELRSFSQFPALEESNLPDDLVVIAQKSTRMDAVWQRLKNSRGYRPLVFAAWEQNRTDYYPPMRIHDEMPLGEPLRPATYFLIADPAGEDPPGANLSSFYRLDGTLQLRRSRFLHLSLDFEYRGEIWQPATQSALLLANDPASPTGNSNNISINKNNNIIKSANISKSYGYNLYSLQQSRQIRTGRMQYFDTPYFGALVLVSAIDAE
jgi:Peptidoglycan-binding protein, CsiV